MSLNAQNTAMQDLADYPFSIEEDNEIATQEVKNRLDRSALAMAINWEDNLDILELSAIFQEKSCEEFWQKN